MASPELELQGAIVARLKADADVTALISTRVYDPVPAVPVFPYVSFGPREANQDDADCITGFEITFQIDAWSRASGTVEAQKIVDAVRVSLHDYDFTLSVNAAANFQHSFSRIFRDPDGLTSHGAMTFTGFVEKR